MRNRSGLILTFVLAFGGCGGAADELGDSPVAVQPQGAEERAEVSLPSDWDARLEIDALERGRRDAAWTRVVNLDTVGYEGSQAANPEEWDQITAESVNDGAMHLPLYGDVAGPSVLRTQILLDRALFSPGIIDGHWGKNTEKALYWFQVREGLRTTARLDEATFERLVERAGGSRYLIRDHTLTADDVDGPFVTIPEDIYDKAELDCLCYESLVEKLSEMFHTSEAVLEKLNPGTTLNSLGAGSTLRVPAVREQDSGRAAEVARIVVSGAGFYVHALDASDRILYHFPTTLGSSFDPSPDGVHRVTSITPDPWWHYQPSILAHVDDDDPDAKIPPGPNNAVGVVWMALSIPHYGIHGTSAPESIGYTTSAGCVRLTNWDATFLSERIREGTPVEFAGTRSADV
jgi:lipoprotein-anchoring transpeptidase ErfK/SrfK